MSTATPAALLHSIGAATIIGILVFLLIAVIVHGVRMQWDLDAERQLTATLKTRLDEQFSRSEHHIRTMARITALAMNGERDYAMAIIDEHYPEIEGES